MQQVSETLDYLASLLAIAENDPAVDPRRIISLTRECVSELAQTARAVEPGSLRQRAPGDLTIQDLADPKIILFPLVARLEASHAHSQ